MKKDELVEFLGGIILLGIGLFMLSKRVIVSSGFGLTIWNFDITTGTIVIPLMIGIVLYFLKPNSIIPKIIILLSVIFIVVSIIMSVRLRFVPTSLFDYLLIIVLIASGTGLLLRMKLTKKQS